MQGIITAEHYSCCIRCHTEFKMKHLTQKYCSKKCYNLCKSNRFLKKYKGDYFKKHEVVCRICKRRFKTRLKNTKHCSPKCTGISMRKYLDIPDCLENSNRKLDKNIGYVRVYVPMHPEANNWGYVYEHRVIVEKLLGRRLEKNEVVHHKNGLRWDNRPENLEVMDKLEHSKLPRSRACSSTAERLLDAQKTRVQLPPGPPFLVPPSSN